MMIYLQKHNKNGISKNRYFGFVLVVLLVLILGYFQKTKNISGDIASYLFKPGSYIHEKISFIPNIFKSKNQLILENQKLKQDILNVTYEIYDTELIRYENERLKNILELKPDNFIATTILAKHPQVSSDTIVIDKGRDVGISENDLVFASERILIGKVSKVFSSSSIVSLNSFPGSVLYGTILKTGDPIEINGFGGGILKAVVPMTFDVNIGDMVGIDSPYSYIIATIGLVDENISLGSKNLLLSVPADLYRQSVIYVGKSVDLNFEQ